MGIIQTAFTRNHNVVSVVRMNSRIYRACEGDKNPNGRRPVMIGTLKVINAQKGVVGVPTQYGWVEMNVREIDDSLLDEHRLEPDDLEAIAPRSEPHSKIKEPPIGFNRRFV